MTNKGRETLVDVENKKAYQKSSIRCPICGQKTVQRVFRCRCDN